MKTLSDDLITESADLAYLLISCQLIETGLAIITLGKNYFVEEF